MPRPERPLESEDSPLLRFAADLRRLREKAGSPTYRELGKRAHYSAATLSDAAGGRRLPTLAVTIAYVEACQGNAEEWEQRWREIAVDDEPPLVESPYVGLAAFQTYDADRFFGREELTEKLLALVESRRFVGVFGASGSGKSSLLRAGLVPRLSSRAVVITPGAHPIEEFAVRLGVLMDTSAVALREELAADPANLWLRVRQFDEDLVLVVDQFEEAFTLASPDECAWLVKALTGGPRVVIGVRADFYGHCGRFPELVEVVERSQVLVGPMTPDELRRAITEPAVRVGAQVETALVTRLVADVAGQAAALPLVSHAMVETWRRRRGMTLSLKGYEDAGGIEHAVARTAEQVFGGFSPDEQRSAKLLFLRLIALGEGTEDTKRRVPNSELDESLLERLASARLVSVDRDTVELTHEALIRSWPRLRDWIAEDRDALRVHRQLIDATDTWEAHGHDPDALYRGVRLAQAKELAGVLTPREQAFLDASLAADTERQTLARRRTRRLRQLVALLSVLVLLLGAVVFYAIRAERETTNERNSALALRAADAAVDMVSTSPEEAIRVALAAYRIAPSDAARDALRIAYAATTKTLFGDEIDDVAFNGQRVHLIPRRNAALSIDRDYASSSLWDLSGPAPVLKGKLSGSGDRVSFSQDGTKVVLPVGRGKPDMYEQWDIADLANPRKIAALPRPVFVTDINLSGDVIAGIQMVPDPAIESPDGSVVANPNGVPVLFRVSPSGQVQEIPVPTDRIVRVSLDADGTVMALVRGEPTATEANVETWSATGKLQRLAEVSLGLENPFIPRFSTNGRFLVVGDQLGAQTQVVVDVSDPSAPKEWVTLRDPKLSGQLVEFGPDNRTLLIGTDGRLRIWNIAKEGAPERVATFKGFGTTFEQPVHPMGSDQLLLWAKQSGLWRIDLDTNRLLATVCARSASQLSHSEWTHHFPGLEQRPVCP